MSLVATRVQNWRIKNPAFDKNMTRPARYGALDFFVDQTDSPNSMITPELKSRSMISMGTTIQIPVINYDADVQVGNVRTCQIADNENTSALVTVVYATYQVGFTMVPAMYSNNEIGYEHDWNRKMEKITRALSNALDVGAVSALEANKTQVMNDSLYYPIVGNDIQVSWNMREGILSDTGVMMAANDFHREMHLIANAGIYSILEKLKQHGEFNDQNKRLEYMDKVLHYTNNIINEAGKFGTGFIVEEGNVGLLFRVDREAARNASANDHDWGVIRLPFMEIPVGYHYYTEVGNQSAIAGASTVDLTCAIKEFFGFSIDVAFLVAYNSNPDILANPIMKFEVEQPDSIAPLAKPVFITNNEETPVFTTPVT